MKKANHKIKNILTLILIGVIAISLVSCKKTEVKDSDLLSIIGENMEDIKEIRITTGKLVPDEYKKVSEREKIDQIVEELQEIKFIEEIPKKETEKEIKPEDINWGMILFTKSGKGVIITSIKSSDNIAIRKGVKDVFYRTDYKDETLEKIIQISGIRQDQIN